MRFTLDNLNEVCEKVTARQELRPDFRGRASRIGKAYVGRRGVMVVDVIASRQRNYEKVVKPRIIRPFQEQRNGTLTDLAADPPIFLKLQSHEVPAMSAVANALLDFGRVRGIADEEEICRQWAQLNSYNDPQGPSEFVKAVRDVKGIGPALLEYLRMLCGADTIKIDVRVKASLDSAGVPVHLFTDDGLYEVCRGIAGRLGFTLVELDQLLWVNEVRAD